MRDTTKCNRCHQWHHPECKNNNCNTAIQCPWEQVQQSTGRIAHHREANNTIQAGDGSVYGGGTSHATGTWSLITITGETIVGQLHCTPTSITSTRCETHALIAGLHETMDNGPQICDNKAAGSILATARWYRQHGRQPKYGNKNRIEIRSLIAAMTNNGTFSTIWVASHKEQEKTSDDTLRQHRNALARADHLASNGHTATMEESYGKWLILDDWQLCDNRNRPVLGNYKNFLDKQLSLSSWPNKFVNKPPSKQLLLLDSLPMLTICYWPHT